MGVGDDVAPRFTQKPALKQEDGGKRLVFQCVLEASPQPEIAWFQGTTPLSPSDRMRMRVEGAGGSAYNVIMEILGVTQGDAGTYKVTAKNRLGEVSASINLNFSAGGQKQQEGIAPNFIQKPVTRQENNGQKLMFECVLTADPAPTITWFKDNAAIAPGGRYIMRSDPRDNKTYFLVMEINGVNAQDAGNYKVTAKNSLGESNATIRLNFDASEVTQMKGVRPVFLQKPAIRQVGDKIVLECKLTAEPKPQVSWFLNNQAITFAPDSRLSPQMMSDGSTHVLLLEISKVSMSDAGEYRAHAKNEIGEATATITLNFEGAKKPELPAGKAPHFTQKPTIKQQQNLLLMTCMLEANPTPMIRWFRDSTEIGAGGRYSITLQRDASGTDMHTAVLQITGPKGEDGGTYKCTAANDLGESNANITLNFAGGDKGAKPAGGVAPTFTEKPKVSQDPSGKNIIITCQCQGTPKPNFIWYKGTTVLEASARVLETVHEEGNKYTLKLEVLNFTKEDGGQYKVTAKNEMGEGSANITINLEPPKEPPPVPQGKPSIRLEDNGKMIIIQQAVSSPSAPACSWYFGNAPVTSGGRLIYEVNKEGNLYYAILKIPNSTDKDSGMYKVVMKNSGGEATTTATVNVDALKPKPKGEGPKVIQKLNPQNVNDGEAVEFIMKVSGTEPLDIQWTKDGKVITSSDVYSVTYDKGTCRLYISEVFPEDSGNYAITIKNEWGTASSVASLQVKEPKVEPKPAGKSEMQITMESKTEMQMSPQQEEPAKKPEPEPAKKPEPEPKKEPEPAKKPEPEPKKEPEPVKKPEPETPKKEPEPAKKPEPEPPKKEPEPAKKPEPKKEPEPAKKPEPKKEPEPAKKPEPEPKKEPEPAKKPEPKKPEEKAPPKKEPEPPKPEPKKPEPEPPKKKEEKKEEPQKKVPDVKVEDTGKVSVDKVETQGKPAPGEGPLFKKKPINQIIMEGETMKLDVELQLDGKPMPTVRYLRAGRELREDSRVSIATNNDRAKTTLTIKKAKSTDEAKYTINLEHNGVITDTATFSVFVKDPKDSNLDFRSLLKHRETKKKEEDEEDTEWGGLKPVDKSRKLSDADLKSTLKKVEKPEPEPEPERVL
ncbi:hypothetical protein ACOMHN_029019 [Nucella lapillus]